MKPEFSERDATGTDLKIRFGARNLPNLIVIRGEELVYFWRLAFDYQDRLVPPCQVFVDRKASHLDLIGDRPNLAFGGFRFEQLRENRDGSVEGRRSLHKIAGGPGHAVHFQAAQHDDRVM